MDHEIRLLFSGCFLIVCEICEPIDPSVSARACPGEKYMHDPAGFLSAGSCMTRFHHRRKGFILNGCRWC